MLRGSLRGFHCLSKHTALKTLELESMSSPSFVLDKSQFTRNLPLVSIKIKKENCTKYQQTFKGHLFDRPRMKRIYDVPEEPDYRFILLKEEVSSPATVSSSLPPALLQFNDEQGGVIGQYQLPLGYDDLSVDEILTKLLPDVSEVPSSFEQVGHLAHMNLREDALQYKHIIGQVILDKNPKLRTVVNKTGQIETEFRTFPMEVLAGDEDFEVSVKESGATFSFNFKDVYWNSRLGTEHNRIISSIVQAEAARSSQLGKRSREAADSAAAPTKQPLPVIADMMGGVGPFSVPLAKSRSCEVHCNDLNPASHACMMKNAKANHCAQPFLRCYNLDGRDFVSQLLRQSPSRPIAHVLMNLPQSATDFLDVFVGYNLKRGPASSTTTEASRAGELLPIVHVYAFSRCVESPLDAIADIAQRSADVMRCPLAHLGALTVADTAPKAANFITLMHSAPATAPLCFGHLVRNVSPKKVMVCLSFRLPESVANSSE